MEEELAHLRERGNSQTWEKRVWRLNEAGAKERFKQQKRWLQEKTTRSGGKGRYHTGERAEYVCTSTKVWERGLARCSPLLNVAQEAEDLKEQVDDAVGVVRDEIPSD